MSSYAYRQFVIHRRVVVNLEGGQAVEGILYRQSGPLVVLKKAVLHDPGAEPLPLDGDTVIERVRILFIQAL